MDDETEQAQVIKFLYKNVEVFVVPRVTLGWTEAVRHSIDVREAATFKILYCRFVHSKKEALETKLKKLLNSGGFTSPLSQEETWVYPLLH